MILDNKGVHLELCAVKKSWISADSSFRSLSLSLSDQNVFIPRSFFSSMLNKTCRPNSVVLKLMYSLYSLLYIGAEAYSNVVLFAPQKLSQNFTKKKISLE